jgi:hypothetical protein
MKKTAVAIGAVLAALAILAPTASAQSEPTVCDGRLTGVVRGDVFVPFAANCVIDEALVTGNVTTEVSAFTLRIEDSVIVGGVSCDACGRLEIERAAVGGTLDMLEAVDGIRLCTSAFGGVATLRGTSTSLDIGNPSADCGGNVFSRTLTVTQTFGPLSVQQNVVARDLTVNLNQRGTIVARNIVGNTLSCEGNQPPPTGSGNVARSKQGQCATL